MIFSAWKRTKIIEKRFSSSLKISHLEKQRIQIKFYEILLLSKTEFFVLIPNLSFIFLFAMFSGKKSTLKFKFPGIFLR